ncbi:MAG TPA: hypothetical protein VK696_08870 [Steroidobacteraceae bacterium]|nr:hypothetical protein [Steroidobacteraceae bacterium]
MAELSEWLKIMLGEVARKHEEQSRAALEHQARRIESNAPSVEPAGARPAEGH